jgi:hypothetical protein
MRPDSGSGPPVVVVAPLSPAREDLGAAMAHHGVVAALLDPSGSSPTEQERSVLRVDNLAALAGTLFARSGSSRPAVGVVAFGAGTEPSVTLARSLPEILSALVFFSDEDLDESLVDVGMPVQALPAYRRTPRFRSR